MNVGAFILALVGAGLSLFQPVIPVIGISFSDLLSSTNSDMKTAAVTVFIIAIAAVICGVCALMRKGKNYCVTGLAVCGVLFLFSIALIMNRQPADTRDIPFDVAGMAMSIWMKTALVWALCYIGAAVLAHLDNPPEANNSSAKAPSAQTPEFSPSTLFQSLNSPSPSPQPQPQPQISKPKDFEPVLGVETPALIKRGKIFLSDDEFDEAERYFEQALRQDPENSQAYLCKLMAQLKVHNIDELSSVSSPLNEQKLFKRALEFAVNDEDKLAVQNCLEANERHLEALKQEEEERLRKQEEERKRKQEERLRKREEARKQEELDAIERNYQSALKVKKDAENGEAFIFSMKNALNTLEKLGSYKDSESLAESLRQLIAKEEEREEKREIERNNAKKGLTFILVFIVVAVVVLVLLSNR